MDAPPTITLDEFADRFCPGPRGAAPLLGPDGVPVAPLAERTAYHGATLTHLADMEQANQRLRGLLNRVSERGNLVAQENLALRRALAKLRGTIVPQTTDTAKVEYHALQPKPAFPLSAKAIEGYEAAAPRAADISFSTGANAIQDMPPQWPELFIGSQATDDPSPSNPSPEQTPVQKRVADVLNDIQTGGMQQPERTKLRGALDKAEAQPTGRAAQDQALGRAIARFHR